MRKLITVGMSVAAVALSAPALASADHVASVTYNGTFTTGTGGTVEFDVAPDGTMVDFTATGFGQTGCTGATFGQDSIPITDHSFFFSGTSPTRSISGSFPSPGVATGSARLSFACDSGFQSWTAETPVVWPDAFLEHAVLGFAGEDIYNSSGNNQVITQRVRQGKTGRFTVHFENEGTEPDAINVAGCGPSKGFRVKFTKGGENVTPQVRSGAYQTDTVDTDESDALNLTIKVSRRANPGKTKTCKVVSSHSGVFRGIEEPITDAVKAQVKVKRAG
jgi:hypothetical protein